METRCVFFEVGPESMNIISINFMLETLNIVTIKGVTIDGVWTGEWVYWPLIHTTQNYRQLKHRR
jgi:hypothetical protein